MLTDSSAITEKFCDYFSKIGQNLASKIPAHHDNSFSQYLTNSVSSSLFFQPTSPPEIMRLIHSLKNNKSSGHDNISAYFLIVTAEVIAIPLTTLFNSAFKLGIFPSCLKIARVIPVFKSGEKTDLNNYRPISILSTFSKILEKLICDRTQLFLDKHSILLSTQYGFRPFHSTSHAMLDLLTSTYDNINDNKHTAFLLLDLKKAFDTVNHSILLRKLQHYGIRGAAYNLFASFLTNRFQFVYISNVKSNFMPITCGVPQGSVLGPLLFTLYINDISNCTTCKPRLFADDTCLMLNNRNLSQLNSNIDEEITTVNNWMIANKLTLNIAKSSVILINSNNKNYNNSNAQAYDLPSKLMSVETAKYLGVTFDNRLSFEKHIHNLVKKLSKAVGILCKVKNFLNSQALLQLYYAIFHSHLQYGLIIWGSTFKTYLKKLTTLQNKAVKIVGGGKYFDHATPYYSKLRILTLVDLLKLEKALFVFKYRSKAPPSAFKNYFSAVYNDRSTRSVIQTNYFIPFTKSTMLQRSIKYQGPIVWNSLDLNIKKRNSLKLFKYHLKKSLLSKYCSPLITT